MGVLHQPPVRRGRAGRRLRAPEGLSRTAQGISFSSCLHWNRRRACDDAVRCKIAVCFLTHLDSMNFSFLSPASLLVRIYQIVSNAFLAFISDYSCAIAFAVCFLLTRRDV